MIKNIGAARSKPRCKLRELRDYVFTARIAPKKQGSQGTQFQFFEILGSEAFRERLMFESESIQSFRVKQARCQCRLNQVLSDRELTDIVTFCPQFDLANRKISRARLVIADEDRVFSR